MCGIVGMASLHGKLALPDVVPERLTAEIRHRGPDDEGFYSDERVLLGMRRLSIIDVDGGRQPLSDESEKLWLVCNGEIYNFRELRAQLEKSGHRFKTRSDCEVILHLYREHGDRFVEHLNGMYGFALWDAELGRFFLVRDRLGVKPLYYTIHKGALIFASEIKAILKVPGVPVSIDPVALEAFLSLGYTPAPLTLIRGVRKLPPASMLRIERGDVVISSYWQVPADVEPHWDEREWTSALRDSIERAVQSQMVSDVPIGAFLSGGVDSSAVVGFMARHSDEPIRTYSIGFEGDGAEALYNELPYARQVSELFKTKHREIVVTPDVVRLLPRLIWHLDEPIADSALMTTFLVAEFAGRDVKVILSGVGGDELFGGYRRYLGQFYDGLYKRIPPWFRSSVIRRLAAGLPSDRHSSVLNASRLVRSFVLAADLPFEERYRRYVEVFDARALAELLADRADEPLDALGLAFRESPSTDALQQLLLVDLKTQLPEDLLLITDKMTMASSLECRVPLLDHELVELAARIPSDIRIRRGRLKYIMKKALADLLPDSILNRAKRGFGAPVGAWIRKQLAPAMRALLSEDAVESRGLLRWSAVRTVIEGHQSSQEDHTDHLSALMNLEIWCRLHLDGQSPEEVAEGLAEGERGGDSVRLPSVSVSS